MTTMIDLLAAHSDDIMAVILPLLPAAIVLIPALAAVRGWVRERCAIAALDRVDTSGCGVYGRPRKLRATKESLRRLGFSDAMIDACRVRLIIAREDARAAKIAAGVEQLRAAEGVRQVRATAEYLRRSEAAQRGWATRRATHAAAAANGGGVGGGYAADSTTSATPAWSLRGGAELRASA